MTNFYRVGKNKTVQTTDGLILENGEISLKLNEEGDGSGLDLSSEGMQVVNRVVTSIAPVDTAIMTMNVSGNATTSSMLDTDGRLTNLVDPMDPQDGSTMAYTDSADTILQQQIDAIQGNITTGASLAVSSSITGAYTAGVPQTQTWTETNREGDEISIEPSFATTGTEIRSEIGSYRAFLKLTIDTPLGPSTILTWRALEGGMPVNEGSLSLPSGQTGYVLTISSTTRDATTPIIRAIEIETDRTTDISTIDMEILGTTTGKQLTNIIQLVDPATESWSGTATNQFLTNIEVVDELAIRQPIVSYVRHRQNVPLPVTNFLAQTEIQLLFDRVEEGVDNGLSSFDAPISGIYYVSMAITLSNDASFLWEWMFYIECDNHIAFQIQTHTIYLQAICAGINREESHSTHNISLTNCPGSFGNKTGC